MAGLSWTLGLINIFYVFSFFDITVEHTLADLDYVCVHAQVRCLQ